MVFFADIYIFSSIGAHAGLLYNN